MANISTTSLYGRSWNTVISECDKLTVSYGTASESVKTKYRRFFLYGMALHTATDTFAHSSMYKDSETGTMKLYYHKRAEQYVPGKSADNIKDDSNRWKCAKFMSLNIADICYNKHAGTANDFAAAYGTQYWNGFYMLHIQKYALESVGETSNEELETKFTAINYEK